MGALIGILDPDAACGADTLTARANAMRTAIDHRDAPTTTCWCDTAAGIALTREQPCVDAPATETNARYVLSLDASLVNVRQLRGTLPAATRPPAESSPATLILAAIDAWGLNATLDYLRGGFALALWDRHERCLWLARDALGHKPLYYGWAGCSLLLGSQLQALWSHPDFDNDVDRDSLALFLELGYIPPPHCIHERTYKLEPGCLLRLDGRTAAADTPQRWWSAREQMHAALTQPFTGTDTDAADELDTRLRRSVATCLDTDADTGLFLSGGIDSSLVAALAQTREAPPVHTFSLGFEGSHHDEAPLARQVAEHLGTEHTELYVSGADALAMVPRLPAIWDEPFADASQVPTALLAERAGAHIDVALSGDGGDELFFGYRRYLRAQRNWRLMARIPYSLRKALACRVSGEKGRSSPLRAAREELGARGIGDIQRQRLSRWRDSRAIVPGADSAPTLLDCPDPLQGAGTAADALMLLDFVVGLPGDMLCKVDRATTNAGVEARSPVLDRDLAVWAWHLPLALKYRNGAGKHLLKTLLARYLPANMVYRPKRGFGAPTRQWLQHDLRDWAGDLLAPDRLRRAGYVDAAAVQAVHARFTGGEHKWHPHLWTVLMFEAWREHWQQYRRQVTGRD